jgi:hypothetical protein
MGGRETAGFRESAAGRSKPDGGAFHAEVFSAL